MSSSMTDLPPGVLRAEPTFFEAPADYPRSPLWPRLERILREMRPLFFGLGL